MWNLLGWRLQVQAVLCRLHALLQHVQLAVHLPQVWLLVWLLWLCHGWGRRSCCGAGSRQAEDRVRLRPAAVDRLDAAMLVCPCLGVCPCLFPPCLLLQMLLPLLLLLLQLLLPSKGGLQLSGACPGGLQLRGQTPVLLHCLLEQALQRLQLPALLLPRLQRRHPLFRRQPAGGQLGGGGCRWGVANAARVCLPTCIAGRSSPALLRLLQCRLQRRQSGGGREAPLR